MAGLDWSHRCRDWVGSYFKGQIGGDGVGDKRQGPLDDDETGENVNATDSVVAGEQMLLVVQKLPTAPRRMRDGALRWEEDWGQPWAKPTPSLEVAIGSMEAAIGRQALVPMECAALANCA